MSTIIRKFQNLKVLLSAKPSEHTNIHVYESDAVVNYYQTQVPALQEAEITIKDRLGEELKDASMLDIGIGAGRTTHFFGPLVKRYVGIDYSEAMVEACRELYKASTYEFKVEDARDLRDFSDKEFDIVMFSFNGLDSIAAKDRIGALSEMRRVVKDGGKLIFSSHNLLSLRSYLSYRYSIFSAISWKQNYRTFVLRKLNPPLSYFSDKELAMVADGSNDYKTKNYWARPSYQVKELEKLGFSIDAIYGLNGKMVPPESLATCSDMWLYYLCTRVA